MSELEEKMEKLIRAKPSVYTNLYVHGSIATVKETALLLEELGYVQLDENQELPETFIPNPDDLRELEIDNPRMFIALSQLGESMTELLRTIELFTFKRLQKEGFRRIKGE